MITTGQTISNLAIANNESVVQQLIIGFFQSKGNLLFNRFRGDDGAHFGGDQERLLNACCIHSTKHLLVANPFEVLLGDLHLAAVKSVSIGSNGQHLWRPQVNHCINGLNFVGLHGRQSVGVRLETL